MIRHKFKVTDAEALQEALTRNNSELSRLINLEDTKEPDTVILVTQDIGTLFKLAYYYGVIRASNAALKEFDKSSAEVKKYLAKQETTKQDG